MPTIRQSEPKDLQKAQYICIETAAYMLRKNKKMRTITTALFADYYIQNEGENCFVLEAEGEVQGYILCSTDLKRFQKAYRGDIFKKIAALSPLWGIVCVCVPLKYTLYHRRYPAHLHIDILEAYQSSGYGSELMHTLLTHLKQKGVPGVMLSCGADNHKAIRFYKKFGFEPKLKAFGSLVMVKTLV